MTKDASSSADLFDVLNRLAERWRVKEFERQLKEWLNELPIHQPENPSIVPSPADPQH